VSAQRLLVANRGEVAIRVMRAAGRLGISTPAVSGPADTRPIVAGVLASLRQPGHEGKKRPDIDTW
jgi:biotin carboxylase